MWTIILPTAFLPLAMSLLTNQRKAESSGLLPENPWKGIGTWNAVKKFFWEIDAVGILLLSAGFALILIPLTIASKQVNGWGSPMIISMLIIGPLCLVAFTFWEANRRLAPHPVVPLDKLRSRTVVSFVIKYTKHYKYFVVVGSCLYITGLGLMIRFRHGDASVASLVGSQIAIGIGGGCLNVLAQLGIQASVSHQQVAAATALLLVCLEIGGAVGAAISSAIWSKYLPNKLAMYLPGAAKGEAMNIFNSVTVASSYAVGTPERIAINRAYQETMQILLIVAICVAVC
jgi:hypothetical protein